MIFFGDYHRERGKVENCEKKNLGLEWEGEKVFPRKKGNRVERLKLLWMYDTTISYCSDVRDATDAPRGEGLRPSPPQLTPVENSPSGERERVRVAFSSPPLCFPRAIGGRERERERTDVPRLSQEATPNVEGARFCLGGALLLILLCVRKTLAHLLSQKPAEENGGGLSRSRTLYTSQTRRAKAFN